MRLVVSHPAAFPLCRELIEAVRPAVDRAEEKEGGDGRQWIMGRAELLRWNSSALRVSQVKRQDAFPVIV
jgi:hypothetical protein